MNSQHWKSYVELIYKSLKFVEKHNLSDTELCNKVEGLRRKLANKYPLYFQSDAGDASYLSASFYLHDLLSGKDIIYWITDYCNDNTVTTNKMVQILGISKNLTDLKNLYQVNISPINGDLTDIHIASQQIIIRRLRNLYRNSVNLTRVKSEMQLMNACMEIDINLSVLSCIIQVDALLPKTAIKYIKNIQKLIPRINGLKNTKFYYNGAYVYDILNKLIIGQPVLHNVYEQLRRYTKHIHIQWYVIRTKIVKRIINK